MGFDTLTILRSYKTNKNNIVKEFYLPVLKEAVSYKRAVGFFSSTALIEISKGISGLIRNKGNIQFIVSPKLSEEDIEAITRGYSKKELIEKALLKEFKEPESNSDAERLNWLANLIADGYLDIKVAFTPPEKSSGMYHEKIAIIEDAAGNKIAFTGSLNETINAFYNNYESIVVFNSLVSEDCQRVEDFDSDFDSLWNCKESNIEIIEFPTAVREKLLSYKKEKVSLDLDDTIYFIGDESTEFSDGEPHIPKSVKLHDYQDEAILTWKNHGYRGIFDMATGTGKTYTGLGAISTLYADTHHLAIIIVCPYQHLVEQWVEDIVAFNMRPTIGYSASKQTDWKNRLSNDIMDFRLGVINIFCFVTTNATFSSDYVQSQLSKLSTDVLLVVDEAHNFGAEKLQRTLSESYEYRLALSATLERHRDFEGTARLYKYFGDKCIEYGLERAIREDKLTPYYYYPVLVYLEADELVAYRDLSKKISKHCSVDSNGRISISEVGKLLLIKRARIVAGARQKVAKLCELMKQYTSDSHILVYCGATKNQDFSSDDIEHDEDGERQIVSVSKMLGFELGMKVTHFTSAESAKEREMIKRQFADVDPYQALVAIKCLDEGVNIPSIKTAFILASSTNPKEYIQRRGRVLRKAPGKEYATIYDFITLPRPLEEVIPNSETAVMDLSLVKKEIIRMQEFGEIALNPSNADELIKSIEEYYGLDAVSEEEYFDE